uniref:HMA domain-containing protein n=1 Tax=Octactis speculum TaxID=3111310 RepID=A0A7S2HNC6_9STRA|mmetsp:Transcript_8082/g.10147  ORF Transcript_8082/g.10147 Transcript_8082/m.10147 type:complete len:157 (+) Transcript_8082:492-962(+)
MYGSNEWFLLLGFAALDIFRPYFVALTFAQFYVRGVRKRSYIITAVALAVLPEVIRVSNRIGLNWRNLRSSTHSAGTQAVVQASVRGVACEACASGLRGALTELDSVESVKVFWRSKEVAEVTMRVNQRNTGLVSQELDRICAVRGYSWTTTDSTG